MAENLCCNTCCDTRCSISAHAIILNGCYIFWLCRKQQSVALPTSKAEDSALGTISCQGGSSLNSLIQPAYAIPIRIMVDNTPTISVAENPINNRRTNNIPVAYHFTRDHRMRKFVTLSCVLSNDNTAYLMTKTLNSVAHHGYTKRFRLSGSVTVSQHTFCSPRRVRTMVLRWSISSLFVYNMTSFLIIYRQLSIVLFQFQVW